MSTDTTTARTFDALGLLADTLATYTASGATSVNGAPRTLDLGDTSTRGVVVAEVSSLDLTSGNESYRLSLQACNAIGFGSNVVELGAVAIPSTGRFQIPFQTRQDMTNYRFVRLYATMTGTTPSMQVVAFLTK